MLQSNPTLRQLLERNPQLRHALSDPKTLRDLLEMSGNPRAMQEMMRGHDRALSNIENLPGGFQALQQFYTQELQEVEAGLHDLKLPGSDSSVSSTKYPADTEAHRLVSEPMPNPWSRRTTMGRPEKGRFGSSETVRTAQLAEHERHFARELATMRELGFTDTRENVTALLAANGNVDLAIDRIMRTRTRSNDDPSKRG